MHCFLNISNCFLLRSDQHNPVMHVIFCVAWILAFALLNKLFFLLFRMKLPSRLQVHLTKINILLTRKPNFFELNTTVSSIVATVFYSMVTRTYMIYQLFDFANDYRGSYQLSCPFYCSYSGYQVDYILHINHRMNHNSCIFITSVYSVKTHLICAWLAVRTCRTSSSGRRPGCTGQQRTANTSTSCRTTRAAAEPSSAGTTSIPELSCLQHRLRW